MGWEGILWPGSRLRSAPASGMVLTRQQCLLLPAWQTPPPGEVKDMGQGKDRE